MLCSENHAWESFSKQPVQYINTLESIAPEVLENDDDAYGLPEELARAVQEECFFPEGLKRDLRRYQEWGVKYILHQKKVLLGDEMGLGKTIQSIAAMVSLKNTGARHFVVICPASVMINWYREIQESSKLRAIVVHGSDRVSALNDWLDTGGVAITTYGTTVHFKIPDGFQYSLLTVDEAHYIKNPSTNRSKNVRTIAEHAERILFMTGTAMENNVDEMVNLIRLLQPNIARQIAGMKMLSSAPKFRETIAPVYFRRKREDVLPELPELVEAKEWCELGEVEKEKYEEAVLRKSYHEARRVSWNVDDLHKSSKAKRLLEIVDQAKSENRKILVFSFYLDTIQKIARLLGDQCTEPINGSISPKRRQEIVDKFEKASAGKVLAAQIIAGGTGLNIQAASVVILCEPQLKPSIENQAISRVYRMGQHEKVLVYHLLSVNTIDEKITDLLAEKQRAFDAFADQSVAAANIEIDQKGLGNIIQEEIDRINEERNVA
jgi:SNF2 family DNA or RNA helicase